MLSVRLFRHPLLWGVFCCALTPTSAVAQEAGDPSGLRTLTAVRLGSDEHLVLDGVLDEPVWHRATPAAGFVQREPATGMPATEATDVRVVYEVRRV
ncbi:MAG: hypothetical protein EHM55_17860, partial [Acidobacteria bacterium]